MVNHVGVCLKFLLEKNNKSISDLSRQAGLASNTWAKVISGSSRISVDMAIRLGKVFGNQEDLADMVTEYESSNVNAANMWLWYQYKSDIANVKELDGPMYRNITPFE